MVNPENRDYITLPDLIECGVGHTVISILTDVQGFFEYDNREALMQVDVTWWYICTYVRSIFTAIYVP